MKVIGKPKQLAFKLIHLTSNISMFGRSAGRILTTASRRTSLAGRARLQAISPPRAGPSTSFARFITSDKGDSLVHPTQQPSTSPDRLADAAKSVVSSAFVCALPPAFLYELPQALVCELSQNTAWSQR